MALTLVADPPGEVTRGNFFSVNVMVAASPANPVDTVQVYLNFDHTKLQVLTLDGGPDLEVPLQSSFDNTLGQINYAAGTLVGTPVDAPFVLVSIRFEAVAATGAAGTEVAFAPLVGPRQTKAIRAVANNTGNLTSTRVVVNP